jgi:hypothetical protein
MGRTLWLLATEEMVKILGDAELPIQGDNV